MCTYKIYSLDDYEQSFNPRNKWDNLEECYSTTISIKYDMDINDIFEEAAERAYMHFGRESGWYDNSPTFVAVDQESGEVFKSTVEIEDRPTFQCGRVEKIE
jgi:hypothetical protein